MENWIKFKCSKRALNFFTIKLNSYNCTQHVRIKNLSEHTVLKTDLFNKDESLLVGELRWLFLASMTFKTVPLVHLILFQISFTDLIRKNELPAFSSPSRFFNFEHTSH